MLRPRLLVITPRFPYPPIGGDKLRIYKLCKHLSRTFDLSLLSLCETKRETYDPLPQIDVFAEIHRIYHGRTRRIWGVLRALIGGQPLQVGYYRNRELEDLVKELVPRHDGALAHLIRTAEYIRSSPKPNILEMTDAIAMSYGRGKSLGNTDYLWRAIHRLEAQRLLDYEPEITRDFSMTIIISSIDHDFLSAAASPKGTGDIIVCSNGVDTGELAYNFAPDGKTIVFIGNNTGFANLDAILYFAKQVLPLVRSRHPAAQFRVIGRIHPRSTNKLLKYDGVQVTGSVADVSKAAAGASVAVCPVRLAAGVQNKLLEYMSLGIPAITSPIGLEGLEARPGREVLTAETPEEWAKQISLLLENRSRAEALAIYGRQYVEQSHSWDLQFQELDHKLATLFPRIKNSDPESATCSDRAQL